MRKRRSSNKKDELYKLSAIEIYDLLLNEEISKFPDGFVTKETMKEIIREVILNRQKLSRQEICDNLSYGYLGKYRLRGSRNAFNTDIFQLITYCFPEYNIKNWELKKVRNGFWEKEENRREYMKWLIQKENINPKKVSDLRRINADMIDKNLGRKARHYSDGIYNLILLVAEISVKEWEVTHIAKWNEEKAVLAVKWLIEEKLKWSMEDVQRKISVKVFYENNLHSLIKNYFNHNVIKALNLAYPGKFKRISNNKIEMV